jgi:RHS repeat-associated protein
MPNRHSSGNQKYRYGFNGMEADDEVKGNGNSYTTEFRQYDSRIGRWLSLDPITHHHFSPYSSFDNNPILIKDPSGADGEEPKPTRTNKFLSPAGRVKAPKHKELSERQIDRNRKNYLLGRGKYGKRQEGDLDYQTRYDQGRDLVQKGKLRTGQFERLYKENDWEEYDPANWTGDVKSAVFDHYSDMMDNLDIAAGMILIVAAPIILPYAIPLIIEGGIAAAPYLQQAATFVGRTSLQAARTYNSQIGMKGGYMNAVGNIGSQYIANGDITKTNVLGVVTAAFTTNNTSFTNRMILGAAGSGGLVSLTLDG